MDGRRLLAGCVALASLAAGACNEVPRGAGGDATGEAPSAIEAAPSGPSIYELPMRLTDQDGRSVRLDIHRGHPVVIGMFYTSCPSACPMLVADVLRIEASLEETTRKDTRVLLVSLDPERDTTRALSAFAASRELDLSRWTLASAPEEDVRALAAVLGLKYRALPDGEINHASIIAVLSRDGTIVHRIDGQQADLAPAAEKLAAL